MWKKPIGNGVHWHLKINWKHRLLEIKIEELDLLKSKRSSCRARWKPSVHLRQQLKEMWFPGRKRWNKRRNSDVFCMIVVLIKKIIIISTFALLTLNWLSKGQRAAWLLCLFLLLRGNTAITSRTGIRYQFPLWLLSRFTDWIPSAWLLCLSTNS